MSRDAGQQVRVDEPFDDRRLADRERQCEHDRIDRVRAAEAVVHRGRSRRRNLILRCGGERDRRGWGGRMGRLRRAELWRKQIHRRPGQQDQDRDAHDRMSAKPRHNAISMDVDARTCQTVTYVSAAFMW